MLLPCSSQFGLGEEPAQISSLQVQQDSVGLNWCLRAHAMQRGKSPLPVTMESTLFDEAYRITGSCWICWKLLLEAAIELRTVCGSLGRPPHFLASSLQC